jgi:hypothetical protein
MRTASLAIAAEPRANRRKYHRHCSCVQLVTHKSTTSCASQQPYHMLHALCHQPQTQAAPRTQSLRTAPPRNRLLCTPTQALQPAHSTTAQKRPRSSLNDTQANAPLAAVATQHHSLQRHACLRWLRPCHTRQLSRQRHAIRQLEPCPLRQRGAPWPVATAEHARTATAHN